MFFHIFCAVLSQYATICFIKTMENCWRLVKLVLTKSLSKFPIVGSSVRCILLVFLLNDSVLLQVHLYYGSVVVLLLKGLNWQSSSWMIRDMEELLISISVSSRSLLVDICVDISPCFLITLKEIAGWLCLASSDDIYIE